MCHFLGQMLGCANTICSFIIIIILIIIINIIIIVIIIIIPSCFTPALNDVSFY